MEMHERYPASQRHHIKTLNHLEETRNLLARLHAAALEFRDAETQHWEAYHEPERCEWEGVVLPAGWPDRHGAAAQRYRTALDALNAVLREYNP